MKRASKDSLDQLIRAARTDAPSRAVLEEMKTLALLGKAAPDGSLGLTSTKSSLSASAGGVGKVAGLLGAGGVLKAGLGFVAVAVVAGSGIVLGSAPLGTKSSPERHSPGETAPPLAPAQSGDRLGQKGEEQSTLPLPPVFDDTEASPSGVSRPDDRSARMAKKGKVSAFIDREARSQKFLAETKMVEAARRALRSNAGEAFRLTEQCARDFPKGIAATERSVIAIEALVRLGRENEARARLSSFELTHPNSFHLPYLRKILAKNPAETQ